MWELDHKESWALKNWCFWIALEKTLESPLDCKEIQAVHPKGNQSWIFIGRTDADTETPIFWLSDAKKWLIGKDSDAGKDWRQEQKGTTEDEMVGWHHWLNGHEFEQARGVGDGQGSLAFCCPWGHNESDTTELIVARDRGGQDTYSFSLILSSVLLSQFFALDWINFNWGWQIKLLLFNRKTTTHMFSSLIVSDFKWKEFLIASVCSFLFNFQIGLYQELKKLGKKA